jgi:uncharacterized membrane protein YedE/YeeE
VREARPRSDARKEQAKEFRRASHESGEAGRVGDRERSKKLAADARYREMMRTAPTFTIRQLREIGDMLAWRTLRNRMTIRLMANKHASGDLPAKDEYLETLKDAAGEADNLRSYPLFTDATNLLRHGDVLYIPWDGSRIVRIEELKGRSGGERGRRERQERSLKEPDALLTGTGYFAGGRYHLAVWPPDACVDATRGTLLDGGCVRGSVNVYDAAPLAGIVLYVTAWVFAGEAWVNRTLEQFLQAYERHHRTRVTFRRELPFYNQGWKFLSGTVERGRAWTAPQSEPELEALRQRWLTRRRINFLGPLTSILLVWLLYPRGKVIELAAMLPFVLAVLLAGYFLGPDLRDVWSRRRAWLWREIVLAAVAISIVGVFGVIVAARLPAAELANILPVGVAILLGGYFLWPLLAARWFGRKDPDDELEQDDPLNRSGSEPIGAAAMDGTQRSYPRRLPLVMAAIITIPFVAAIAVVWFSVLTVGPARP